MTTLLRVLATLLILLALAPAAPAQGVALKSKAAVLSGEASNASRPATIDIQRVAEATPEYKEIKAHSLDESSARYGLLIKAMMKRIKDACRSAAADGGNDLVVRAGDIQNDKGLTVTDLTDKVIEYVEKS